MTPFFYVAEMPTVEEDAMETMGVKVERLLALSYLRQGLLRKRIRNQAVALLTGKNVLAAHKASIIDYLLVKLSFVTKPIYLDKFSNVLQTWNCFLLQFEKLTCLVILLSP